MKMVIAGGRDFIGCQKDLNSIVSTVQKYDITEIISGGAPGADYFGEGCADRMGILKTRFLADWIRNGKTAGPIRNRQMAEYTDYVFLFPGGSGTASMRREAQKAGKKIVYDNGWI